MRAVRSGPAWAATAARTEPVSHRVVAGAAPERVARSLTKAQPVGGWMSGICAARTRAASGGRQAARSTRSFAGQPASQSREDQTDSFLGFLAGGVGAFVADLLQHPFVRLSVWPPSTRTSPTGSTPSHRSDTHSADRDSGPVSLRPGERAGAGRALGPPKGPAVPGRPGCATGQRQGRRGCRPAHDSHCGGRPT